MKVNSQDWLLAPIPMCALIFVMFYTDNAPLHRIGTWAIVLSMAWVLTRDYTNVSPKIMNLLLVGLYSALGAAFLFLLPHTPDYRWWRFGGSALSLLFALYIGWKNLRKTI